ncbi:Hypothetical protein PBC10988_16850 [Planctomycetales bacterium 10988]|nr:Hypothetical protein PBC10988_16850 [Planctomycetales bacterium 10988]
MHLTQTIRETVHPTHERIEKVAFSRQMISGKIGKKAYGRALSQLWFVHRVLENHLRRYPELAEIFEEEMSRTEVLAQDLKVLGQPLQTQPLAETIDLIEDIEHWSYREPVALLGALYIFEGSRMGSMYLGKSLAKGFDRPAEIGQGLDYHLQGSEDRPKKWKSFKNSLDTMPLSEDQQQAIVDAAEATMNGMYALYASFSVEEEKAMPEHPASRPVVAHPVPKTASR